MTISLNDVKIALKQGNKLAAKRMLGTILAFDKNNAEAWLLLTKTDISDMERWKCYRNILKIEPGNKLAKQGMAMLDKKHKTSASEVTGPITSTVQSISPRMRWIIVLSTVILTICCACWFFFGQTPDSSDPTPVRAEIQQTRIPGGEGMTDATATPVHMSKDDWNTMFMEQAQEQYACCITEIYIGNGIASVTVSSELVTRPDSARKMLANAIAASYEREVGSCLSVVTFRVGGNMIGKYVDENCW